LVIKGAKRHGGGTPARTVTSEPLAGNTLKTPAMKKSTMITHTSIQRATDQLVADERRGGGGADKEIQVDPSDVDKKLRISTELEAK
jgi:hypothetical protein